MGRLEYSPNTILRYQAPGDQTLQNSFPLEGLAHLYMPISRVRCCVCRRRSTKRRVVNIGCERCGNPMHDSCFLRLVATEDERHRLLATDESAQFFCGRCRQ